MNKIELGKLQQAKEESNLILEEKGTNLFQVLKSRNTDEFKKGELLSKKFILGLPEDIKYVILSKNGDFLVNFELKNSLPKEGENCMKAINNNQKEEVLNKVVANVNGDADVCKYSNAAKKITKELLDNCVIQESEESCKKSTGFILTATHFNKNSPGGSSSDIVSNFILQSLKGFKIVSANEKYIAKIVEVIEERALYPEREIAYLKDFKSL